MLSAQSVSDYRAALDDTTYLVARLVLINFGASSRFPENCTNTGADALSRLEMVDRMDKWDSLLTGKQVPNIMNKIFQDLVRLVIND